MLWSFVGYGFAESCHLKSLSPSVVCGIEVPDGVVYAFWFVVCVEG